MLWQLGGESHWQEGQLCTHQTPTNSKFPTKWWGGVPWRWEGELLGKGKVAQVTFQVWE